MNVDWDLPRCSKDKSPFEFFLPVWINQAHAADQAKWQQELLRSVKLIAARAFEVTDEDEAILEVFPRLINQMIVEMMRPDASKSAAIATFEALCNFWRTFRWLVDTRPKLRGRVGTRLSNFVKDESFRREPRPFHDVSCRKRIGFCKVFQDSIDHAS